MKKADIFKWSRYGVPGILLVAGLFLFLNRNDPSKVVLADEAMENAVQLHNAMGDHACDCFQPWISNVTISNVTSTSFDVTWDCGTYTGGAGPATYQVTYGTTTAKSSIYPEARPTVTYTNHTVTVPDLTPDTKYYVGVKSHCLANCARGGGPNFPKTFQQSPHVDNWEVTTSASVETYAVSGTVSISSGALAGVTVTLSGGASEEVTTGADGSYLFEGLEPGTYTVTPKKDGFSFDPPYKTHNLSGALEDQNFAAQPVTSVRQRPLRSVMSDVKTAKITAKDVTITWKTDIPATSMIEYGLTPKFGMKSGLSSIMEYNHSIQLFELQKDAVYYARAVSYSENNPEEPLYSDAFSFRTPAAEDRIADRKFIINEPNPASTWTMFTYHLYQPVKSVTIDVLTLSGKLVKTLESPPTSRAEGWNKVRWDNINLKNGLYIYRMKFRTENNVEEVIQCSTLRIQR